MFLRDLNASVAAAVARPACVPLNARVALPTEASSSPLRIAPGAAVTPL